MHNAASGCLQQPNSDTPTAQFLAPGYTMVKGHSACWHSPLIRSPTPQRTLILFTCSKCFNVRHMKKLWKKYINSNQWKNDHKSASPSGKNALILRLNKISSYKHHIRLLKLQRKRYTNMALALFLQSFSGILRHRNWRILKKKVKNQPFAFHFPHSRKTIEWREGTDHSGL